MRCADTLIERIAASSGAPSGKRRAEIARELRAHAEDFAESARHEGHGEDEIARMVLASFDRPDRFAANFAWVYRWERALVRLAIFGLGTVATATVISAVILVMQAGAALGFGRAPAEVLASRHTAMEAIDILSTVAAYIGILSIENLFRNRRLAKSIAVVASISVVLACAFALAGERATFLTRLQVKGRWMQVVGVVRNSKYSSLLEAPRPFFYTPLRQGPMGGANILIRTRLSPESLAHALTTEVKSIDANLAAGEAIGMQTMIDRRTWSQRAAVTVLAIFGGMALLLAGIGLYGVMAYSVSQSRRELGLRMALGADAADLLRIVVSHGLSLTVAGAAAGALIALMLTRLMGDLLYKVDPRDPLSFGLALTVMVLTALAASLVPGLRAARTDPVRALRD